MWQQAARPGSGLERVETRVRRDAVEPIAEGSPTFEAVARPPRTEEGFLDEVFGFVKGAQHAVAMHLELVPVWFHQLLKRILTAEAVPRRHHAHTVAARGGTSKPASAAK